MFVFGIVVIEVWHTQMPVWAYIIALLLGMLYRASCMHTG